MGGAVGEVLEDARLLVQQAGQHGPRLVSILIEGAPIAGKTVAIAATLAKESGFPLEDLQPRGHGRVTESKCTRNQEGLRRRHRSSMSCVLVDNIERLCRTDLNWSQVFQFNVQALLVLLKETPLRVNGC